MMISSHCIYLIVVVIVVTEMRDTRYWVYVTGNTLRMQCVVDFPHLTSSSSVDVELSLTY